MFLHIILLRPCNSALQLLVPCIEDPNLVITLPGDGLALNTLRPRQNGRNFPDDIFKCLFWMKMYKFWFRFHWSLFPRVQLTMFQHWFSQWLGAGQATSLYQNQCWYVLLTHRYITRPQWVNSSPTSAAYMRQVNRVSIGSDNGLSPGWCQAII